MVYDVTVRRILASQRLEKSTHSFCHLFVVFFCHVFLSFQFCLSFCLSLLCRFFCHLSFGLSCSLSFVCHVFVIEIFACRFGCLTRQPDSQPIASNKLRQRPKLPEPVRRRSTSALLEGRSHKIYQVTAPGSPSALHKPFKPSTKHQDLHRLHAPPAKPEKKRNC